MISEIIYLFLFIHTTSCCFYTSFLFLINVLHCISYADYTYASIFFSLFMTSSYFYLFKDGFYLDQISILLTVFYGGILFFYHHKKSFYSIVAVSCFLSILYFFHYGYLTNRYCYGAHGNVYHSFVHILTSIGHAAVLSL